MFKNNISFTHKDWYARKIRGIRVRRHVSLRTVVSVNYHKKIKQPCYISIVKYRIICSKDTDEYTCMFRLTNGHNSRTESGNVLNLTGHSCYGPWHCVYISNDSPQRDTYVLEWKPNAGYNDMVGQYCFTTHHQWVPLHKLLLSRSYCWIYFLPYLFGLVVYLICPVPLAGVSF